MDLLHEVGCKWILWAAWRRSWPSHLAVDVWQLWGPQWLVERKTKQNKIKTEIHCSYGIYKRVLLWIWPKLSYFFRQTKSIKTCLDRLKYPSINHEDGGSFRFFTSFSATAFSGNVVNGARLLSEKEFWTFGILKFKKNFLQDFTI